MMQISKIDEFPAESHFAAIEFDSIWVEGDERSKTHPGHGYPGYSKSVVNYVFLKDREALTQYVLKKEIPKYGSPQRNYVIIEAKKLNIQLKTEVCI